MEEHGVRDRVAGPGMGAAGEVLQRAGDAPGRPDAGRRVREAVARGPAKGGRGDHVAVHPVRRPARLPRGVPGAAGELEHGSRAPTSFRERRPDHARRRVPAAAPHVPGQVHSAEAGDGGGARRAQQRVRVARDGLPRPRPPAAPGGRRLEMERGGRPARLPRARSEDDAGGHGRPDHRAPRRAGRGEGRRLERHAAAAEKQPPVAGDDAVRRRRRPQRRRRLRRLRVRFPPQPRPQLHGRLQRGPRGADRARLRREVRAAPRPRGRRRDLQVHRGRVRPRDDRPPPPRARPPPEDPRRHLPRPARLGDEVCVARTEGGSQNERVHSDPGRRRKQRQERFPRADAPDVRPFRVQSADLHPHQHAGETKRGQLRVRADGRVPPHLLQRARGRRARLPERAADGAPERDAVARGAVDAEPPRGAVQLRPRGDHVRVHEQRLHRARKQLQRVEAHRPRLLRHAVRAEPAPG